jgi:predicted enzyme related to lactoylglutathione lyase
MKPKLESAYIAVENINRAINFYEWFLERLAAKKGESLYLFDVDGFRLFLFDHNNENEKIKYGDNCLLSFEVDDAEKTKEKIEDRGLKIVFPLTKILDNIVFEFEDPEGNQIEVFSKVSKRKNLMIVS